VSKQSLQSGRSVLALSCRSTSVKAAVVDEAGVRHHHLMLDDLGTAPQLWVEGVPRPVAVVGVGAAVHLLLDELALHGVQGPDLVAVGHRVVHGGDRYSVPVLADTAVEAAIADFGRFAPLHNPAALEGLRAARARLPAVPHVAVFDTAFHSTLPRRAREYALPRELAERHGLRRYGFHGLSHDAATAAAAGWLGVERTALRIVSCHLGAGASVCAVEYGRSVDTSMGMTPLEGLVMATRAGDLDAGVLLELLRAGHTHADLERLLNHGAGLLGLTGTADMRVLERRAREGDAGCRLALQIYAHRVRKYIGAAVATMGGVDAIVFTGGVAEHSPALRRRIVERLGFLGAEIDEDRNRDARVDAITRVVQVSPEHGRCPVLVVASDTDRAIAAAARRVVDGRHAVASTAPIPIAVSARHVHLTRASVEQLFGPGRRLTVARPISQPGQFAAAETVVLVGPAGRIEQVRVVGPERAADQVEISRTDEFVLGVDAPVRESADLERTPGLRLEGPAGSVELLRGVICSLRHIHMQPADAAAFGVVNGDRVDVRVGEGGRELTFGEVRIRVGDNFRLEMHVDTDEANAAGIATGSLAVLEGVHHSARIVTRR